jgi:Tol biopolymer transport system component
MTRTGHRRLGSAVGLCVAAVAVAAVAVGAAGAAGASKITIVAPAYVTFIEHPRSIDPSVAIAHTDGSGVRTLGHGSTALISPDGGSVAVVEDLPDNAGSTLSLYPSAGGAARQLYHSAAFINLLGWSADSRLLLAAVPSGLKETGPLLAITAASGATQTIARGVIQGASFSRAGSDDVVYALSHSLLTKAPVNLFTSSPNGGERKQLTDDGHSLDPLWGPRGIVFARFSTRGEDEAPINQLWSIDADGGGAKQLTHMSVGPLVEGLAPVAFSANGKHLLAVFSGEDTSASWTVDLSGPTAVVSDLNKMYDGNVPDGISRDGKTILLSTGFEGSLGSVETLPWHGGRPKVLAKGGANASWNE